MAGRVVIVGAGPVGLVTALSLVRQGIPVTVLEAGEAVGTESRASTFHAPTLEMLDELGVAQELIARGLIAPTYQFRDRDAGVVAELDMSLLADVTRFPFRLQCPQDELARIIARRLEQTDEAEVRYGQRVTDVRVEAEAAVVGVDGGPTLRVPWLVGADGAHSRVRESLGIDFPGMTYPERYLTLSTPYDLAEAFPDLASVNYVSDPQRWYVLLRTPQSWRVLFPVPMDMPDEEVTSEEHVQGLMRTVVDLGRPFPVEHVTLYKVHQRVAETFRAGRVLLAGDAAHINNPLGGMGMNSGIHDAVFLARALGRVWRGEAGEEVLDAYAEQRRRIAIEYVGAETRANWTRLREADPDARARQQRQWRELVADPGQLREFLLRASMLASLREVA